MPLSQAQHSALSVTAAPCHLSQRERQERFATIRAFYDYGTVFLAPPLGELSGLWPD